MYRTTIQIALLAMAIGVALCVPFDIQSPRSHRVRRGHGGSGISSVGAGATVVDGIAVHAVSGGANNFVNSYRASQNFLASSGRKNYLAQQGGLQAAAWAGSAAAHTGFQYDSIATGKNLPSNVAGYQGFPSYGRK